MYCESMLVSLFLIYSFCFNRALCIVNVKVNDIVVECSQGFNRALCIVNKLKDKLLEQGYEVLIEHYVL